MPTTYPNMTQNRYDELNRACPLRPIRSEDELARAIGVIDTLVDREELDQDESDYLDVLSDQVEKYETEHHPLPAVTEADMLRHLIEARNITQTQLSAETEIAESSISAILSGKRGLSKSHVAVLSRYFHVSPAVFISV